MKSFYLKKIKVLNINFGPQHTAAHGVLSFLFLLLYGYGLYVLLAYLNTCFLQELTVEIVPKIVSIQEVMQVVTVNQDDVILPTGKSWTSYLVKNLAITTVIVVAGPAFFPVISSSVISGAV
jgi:hypothetical protein